MNATQHAKAILDIVDDVPKKKRVEAMNLCLNNFYDSINNELFKEKKVFDAPDEYYAQLEELTNDLIMSADSENKDEFMKAVTSLRVLLNKPAPRPISSGEALQ